MRRTTTKDSLAHAARARALAANPGARVLLSDLRGNFALTNLERVGRDTGSDLLPGTSRRGG